MKAFSLGNRSGRKTLGSTTTEILIVVLVMASIVCFLIPPARQALIKGREASDVARIREAHFQFQYLYMTEDDFDLPNSRTDACELVKRLLKEEGESKLYYVLSQKQNYGISRYFDHETKTYYITYTPRYINGGEQYEWAFAGEDIQFLKSAQ